MNPTDSMRDAVDAFVFALPLAWVALTQMFAWGWPRPKRAKEVRS